MQRISLVRQLEGAPRPEDFRLEEAPIPEVPDGRFLVANRYVSADPGTRSRLSAGASYAPPLSPGSTIDGFAIGTVLRSRHPGFPEGALVTHGGGWASHALLSGRGYCALVPDLGVAPYHWVSTLGVPGLTAWFGLARVGGMARVADGMVPGAPGDGTASGPRLLVTSAAGPVGATAGQLALRVFGAATVVGLAGSDAKRRWLRQDCGFHAALDYRDPGLEAAVADLFPGGITHLFDNVGNAMIDRMLPFMAPHGRIIVSGQVADYNLAPDAVPGIRRTREFIARRLRMEGLVVFDDAAGFAGAQAEMAALLRDGRLKTREVIGQGLESLPHLFCGLFDSPDYGRRLARIGAAS